MKLLVEIDDCRFEAEGPEYVVMARYAEWVDMLAGRHPENPGIEQAQQALRGTAVLGTLVS